MERPDLPYERDLTDRAQEGVLELEILYRELRDHSSLDGFLRGRPRGRGIRVAERVTDQVVMQTQFAGFMLDAALRDARQSQPSCGLGKVLDTTIQL